MEDQFLQERRHIHHSSQNTLLAECGKALARDKESSSKPARTCSRSEACPLESRPRAAEAPPRRPASSAASSRLLKQTRVGPPDESAPELHDHGADPKTRSQSPRAGVRSYPRGCYDTYATFIVTITRENISRNCYSSPLQVQLGITTVKGATHVYGCNGDCGLPPQAGEGAAPA
jgi:hypothetical protein